MKNQKTLARGFTLLELLLVITIMSSIMVMIISYGSQKTAQLRREKTALQINEILNAGLAFYLNTGHWPSSCTSSSTPDAYGYCFAISTNMAINVSELLINSAYLPTTLRGTPYPSAVALSSNYYITKYDATTFYVYAPVNTGTAAKSLAEANIIASMVPNGTASTYGAGPTALAGGSVTIPGQNLGNARSINFSSVYNSGACVPEPVCPSNMKSSILVAPASVNGVSNADPSIVYPITSFVAFARGDASNLPSTTPLDCAVINSATPYACQQLNASDPVGQKYWRVCLSVMTSQGRVSPTNATTGLNLGAIVAMTRCVPNSGAESPVGTAINIWTPNNNP